MVLFMSWFQTPDCVDKLKAHTHRIALLCGTLGRIQAEMKNLVDVNKFMGSIIWFENSLYVFITCYLPWMLACFRQTILHSVAFDAKSLERR